MRLITGFGIDQQELADEVLNLAASPAEPAGPNPKATAATVDERLVRVERSLQELDQKVDRILRLLEERQ